MPHLTARVPEGRLAGNEPALITALTAAVVQVYGEWARDLVVVHLDGVPRGRWGVGGKATDDAAPAITFGIREAALTRPGGDETAARLVAALTDAVAGVLGSQVRSSTSVELVATPAGRSGVGGSMVLRATPWRSPQQGECLVGVGDGLGVNVAGGSPVGDFLPVGPREYPLDREYLGGSQPGLDAQAEGTRQCLLVLEHVLREPSGQAWRGEDQPVERDHFWVIVEAGDGIAAVEAAPEVPVQRRHGRDAGLAVAHDARGLAVVIREPVQYQVLLGGEVAEEGRLGDLGRRGDVVDRDVVEAVRQEQRDRRVGDGVAGPRLLAGPQPRRLGHLVRVTLATRLLF